MVRSSYGKHSWVTTGTCGNDTRRAAYSGSFISCIGRVFYELLEYVRNTESHRVFAVYFIFETQQTCAGEKTMRAQHCAQYQYHCSDNAY
jgi:hypothetical protein